MVKLIAETPLAGHLPLVVGSLRLFEVSYDCIQGVAPFKGQEQSVRQVIKSSLKAELPLPNRVIGPVHWVGPGQYLILGDWVSDLDGKAAVTDQSDAWAIMAVQGADVEAVLARLIPIDLRFPIFSQGQTARTLVGHMTASVTRVSADRIDVMVMRSMAGTLAHEVSKAAKLYAARS